MLQLDSTELGISVSYNSRSTQWAYFDVRGRIEPRREIAAEMRPVRQWLLVHAIGNAGQIERIATIATGFLTGDSSHKWWRSRNDWKKSLQYGTIDTEQHKINMNAEWTMREYK